MAATKKRPTGDEIKAMLLEGHFQQDGDLPPSDPVTTVQLVLKLDDIKLYDRNPRREINPEYDKIKASIRDQRGLNNHFNVTRRPGEDQYMIESGGNTRLKILRELWEETGDDIFNQVHCLFVPWQSESHLLSAHLIENELRGEMTLIDKAYAIKELKTQMELEQGETLSQRAFLKAAGSIGYHLSARHVRRFEYALELDQIIPETLRSGLGAHKIDEIKKTEKAYRQLCDNKTNQLAALFAHIMSEVDGNEWNLETVRRELDQRLSDMLDLPARRIRLEVDAILFTGEATQPETDDSMNEENRQTKETSLPAHQQHLAESIEPKHKDESTSVHDHKRPANKKINGENETITHTPITSPKDEQPLSTTDFITPPFNQKPHLPAENDLKSLRSRCYILALKIAKSVNLEHVITPVKQGFGFIIDSPEKGLDKPAHWGIWWLLLGINEQSVSEQRLSSWRNTQLYRLFSQNDDALLALQLGNPPALQTYFYEFLSNSDLLSDKVFADCFRLIESCRIIRRHFQEQQLWSDDQQQERSIS
jgi:ParB family protein of integrating conjugative element (PFGI_1 class)